MPQPARPTRAAAPPRRLLNRGAGFGAQESIFERSGMACLKRFATVSQSHHSPHSRRRKASWLEVAAATTHGAGALVRVVRRACRQSYIVSRDCRGPSMKLSTAGLQRKGK